MGATIPTRVDLDLFEAAKTAGDAMSRSAAQQLTHWARLGRELEASASVRLRDIQRVLAGAMPYDGLAEPDQAVVRATWEERIAERRETLDLSAEFARSGQPWAELDDHGQVIDQRPAAS